MIIDSHQHFWKYRPERDVWIDETMGVLKRDFLPKDLASVLEGQGIDGCVAVQADQSEQETEFLLQCAEEYTFIKGVVGWVDLCDTNLEERLSYFTKNTLLKGFRHIAQAEEDDYFLREKVQRGIAMLSKYQLTFDLLIYPQQLPSAIVLVKKFPKQKFVLDHIAKPAIRSEIPEFWRSQIQQLAKNKNVFCKLSGMVTEAPTQEFKNEDFTPYMEHVFHCFGPERILFGSDWPVCLLASDYKKVFGLVQNFITSFDKRTQAGILGENAIAFYNL
jgi:L-fuconolactonase